MRPLIAILGVSALAVTAALASRDAPMSGTANVTASPAPSVTADPSDTARAVPARGRALEDAEPVDRRYVIHGLLVPIEDAALPEDVDLLPNATRDYRAGQHEGIDFPAALGTPVRAVAAGTVLRVDRDFTDWIADERNAALDEAVGLGYTPAATLDRIRGRQVWIDHGHGVTSRYAHLSTVADALVVGAHVDAAQIVGEVGSSGYPEGGPHLHLEIWRANRFLGEGLAGDALREAVASAFGQAASSPVASPRSR